MITFHEYKLLNQTQENGKSSRFQVKNRRFPAGAGDVRTPSGECIFRDDGDTFLVGCVGIAGGRFWPSSRAWGYPGLFILGFFRRLGRIGVFRQFVVFWGR